MNRRDTVFALVALSIATDSSIARQSATMPRVGLLGLGLGTSGNSPLLEAFRSGLREHGYGEGQNIVLEDHSHLDRYNQLAKIAEELVRRKVDIIATYGDAATRAARNATTRIPIVMLAGSDPVAAGLAETLARPGGNVTGLAILTYELNAKRLELLKESIPGLRRVAILLNAASRGEVEQLKLLQAAAESLKLKIYPAEVHATGDFDEVFAAIEKQRVGGFTALPSTMLLANQGWIIDLAAKQKLPGIFASSSWADAGGLMSYGPNLADTYRRAAYYVDKILKGAKPGDLPIEQPTKFELVVNFKTAKTLGFTIPQELLLRADRVIQ